MIRYEDFPKKCLKCKKTDISFEKFQIAIANAKYKKWGIFSRSTEILYNSYSVKFPVCRNCKKKFERFRTTVSIFYFISILNIITFFITLFLIYYPNINIRFPFNVSPFMISIILAVILGIIVRTHPHRIHNYIEITKNGKILIKDPEYKKEFDEYKKMKLVEEELGINQISCPKCNSLIKKDADFCNFCGKDLRNN